VVLDASAALQLCSDPDGPAAFAALRPSAPALLWSEFTALVSQQRWRREISSEHAASLLEVFLGTEILRVSSEELYNAASDVAVRLGWAKTYDAEYVALAMMYDLPLVTLDARLRRRVEEIVTVLTPDEALA
jgi:predicted nucleic acid-binding protein